MLVSCRFEIHEDDRMGFLLASMCHSRFACWCCHLSGYKSLGCREMSLNHWEYFSLDTKLKIYKHVLSSERQSLKDCLWERIWLRTFRFLDEQHHSDCRVKHLLLSYLVVTAAWNMFRWRNNLHSVCSKSECSIFNQKLSFSKKINEQIKPFKSLH